jgi:CubicO group peptidase (beta-lactamase class C family)
VSFTLISTGCRSHQEGEDRFADVRSEILDFIEEEQVPSVSVAVGQHGRIVWEESFGWANCEKQIKATPNTMYELASIAKVFTTTGLMVLKERGRINLDAPVDRYLGDVRIKTFGLDASGVTLRRIVQHTSGLPMFWGEPSTADTNRQLTQKEILGRYAILAFKPGERELYSNLGIGLLTHVIEEVTHQSYADFLKESVFLPLGLTNTMRLSVPANTDQYAQQYDRGGKPWTYEQGLYASAHDLVRFGMFHLKDHLPDQRPILGDSTLDLMQTSIDPLSDFRLPWWVWEYNGFRALVFTGASGTIIALLPEADLAIVVLANRLQANTPRICGMIARTVLDGFDERQRIPTQVRTHAKIQPPMLSRGSLAGMWKGCIVTPENDLPVEISFEGTGYPQMRSMNSDGSWGSWVETMSSLRGSYSGGIFSAYFPIRIPILDTRRYDHWTWIYVGLDSDTLRGYAVAHARGGPYFGLPYYIRLER